VILDRGTSQFSCRQRSRFLNRHHCFCSAQASERSFFADDRVG